MQEHQVTIGDTTYPLPEPFLVLATQNPIEQEGTYPLPEAQVDRFMLKLKVGLPVARGRARDPRAHGGVQPAAGVNAGRDAPRDPRGRASCSTRSIVDDKVKDYIVDLVFATREPEGRSSSTTRTHDRVRRLAARLALSDAGRPGPRLPQGRGYVTPQDVKAIALDVLRHRVIVTYEAEAEDDDDEDVIERILDGGAGPLSGSARRRVELMLATEILRDASGEIQVRTQPPRSPTCSARGVPLASSRGAAWSSTRSAQYVPGDEVRTIDWNVTARTGAPHVKRYVEERELTRHAPRRSAPRGASAASGS